MGYAMAIFVFKNKFSPITSGVSNLQYFSHTRSHSMPVTTYMPHDNIVL